MGPMLMTGLTCFGAAVAIGLLAAATSQPTTPTIGPSPSRSLAIISMAIAAGSGVLGVVVGLIAVVSGAVADPSTGVLAAAPAILGGVIGLGLIVRGAGSLDGAIVLYAALFLLGMATLGPVVALMATFIPGDGGTPPSDWPFVILAVAAGGSALAIGLMGARSLQALAGADESTAKAIVVRQISRSLPFQLVGIGATVIAILLLVID